MPYRLANIEHRAVLVKDDHYFDLAAVSDGRIAHDPMIALEAKPLLAEVYTRLETVEPAGAVRNAVFGPPVPYPRNCFAIGLNYRAHAGEAEMQIPAYPMVFTKFPSCIAGPTVDVEMRSDRCDYEGELVVVIGPGGKDIPPDRAWEHVAGLTIGQDFSDRKVQFQSDPPQFALGKSFDTFGPTGPVIVSPDCFSDLASLRIRTFVNDDLRQDDVVANMIFDVPTLVSFLSRITTLRNGDLIFSGTPKGVGAVHRRYLEDGDVVTTVVEGIGQLRNRCVRASDWREV